jgi:4-diphosphocytidyl-2-C-methyl-D-erythritol kinase
MTATERAPAKINLCLHVTGQRADGYHLLDSLVVFTEFGDSLTVQAGQGLSLGVQGPEAAGLGAGPDNLVWRAARLLGAEDMALVLHKELPLASGIGGGSSDAAACLRLVARMTGRPLPAPAEILGLGADVPVCLAPQPCRMQGVGEEVRPVAGLPEFWLVLANPRVEVPTPQVFRALARRDNPPMPAGLPHWPDAASLFGWLASQRNDLEAPAFALAPIIEQVRAALAAMPGCALARMSGSGATCFGLFATAAQAQKAAQALCAAHPDWWVVATPRLS